MSAHPNARYDYIRDGGAIYARSFAMIRAESDLARWSGAAERVVVRMIHACGMTDLPRDVEMSDGFAVAGEAALKAGAPILCDVRMVADGVTRARLPAKNEVLCTLGDPRVPALAEQLGTTRSAAAMELWREHLPGSVVAVGNAPTALFVCSNSWTRASRPRPPSSASRSASSGGGIEGGAGAGRRVPFVVVHGRRGGSAMTAAPSTRLRTRSSDGGQRAHRRPGRDRRRGRGPRHPEDRHALRGRHGAGRSRLPHREGDPRAGARAGARAFLQAGQARQCPHHRRRGDARPAREFPLAYPYTTELPPDHPDYVAALAGFYDEASDRLADHLGAGRDVAILSEGDPFFYGSFMHLWRRLKDRFPVEVIPGVTGMSGCWTRPARRSPGVTTC